LTKWSVHVEDFNDNDLCPNLRDSELLAPRKPQVALGLGIVRHDELDWGQSTSYGWGLLNGQSRRKQQAPTNDEDEKQIGWFLELF